MRLGLRNKIRQCHEFVFKSRLPLLRFALFGDTTQYGEYGLLSKHINTRSGFIVDVGANDGVYCSNTYPFIKRGCAAILIEPNPKVFAKLKELYRGNTNIRMVNAACGSSAGILPLFLGKDDKDVYATLSTEQSDWYDATRENEHVEVKVYRLEDILDSNDCPLEFDFISIDTEGYDYHVLSGMNLARYRPHFIITEDEKPPYTYKSHKADLLKSYNYTFYATRGNNSVWRKAN